MIETYWRQLQDLADEHDVDLLEACIISGAGDSIFYRARSLRFLHDIKIRNAQRIFNTILAISRKPKRKHIGNNYAELIDGLVRRRRRQGISQAALDNKIGCADGLVGKWECGDRVPKPTSFLEWCQALHVRLTIRKVR